MTQPIASRTPEPLVQRNRFRNQSYTSRPIPPFQEIQPLLPEPILPQRPHWVEMYWRAWEIAWSNLHQPRTRSGFVSNYISNGSDDYVSMWDSASVIQFGLYGRRAFDFTGSLDNFYARQHDDGFICRLIHSEDGSDFHTPFDPNSTGPNVMAWAEWRAFRHSRDEERLEQIFWPLLALHRWQRRYRTWPNGLYWATGLSSGMENQPRVPGGENYHAHWTWVDANMQASLNCWALAQMAQVLEETELAGDLNEERAFLQREINAHLWNDDSGFYHDIDPAGRFSPAKSIGAYWGLLDKDMVPEDRLQDFLRHLRDTQVFNHPHRVPSLSADSPGYAPENGDFWRGGVSSPTNYMVIKGLQRVGQRRLAHDIAVNHLENVSDVFQHTDTFWQTYAPESAAPGQPAHPNYVGWSGLSAITILLEAVIGINIDWPLRRITWNRHLAGEGRYGVRNLPLGPNGRLEMTGDGNEIEVKTTLPFSLTIRYGEETLQTAVPSGVTTLTLG